VVSEILGYASTTCGFDYYFGTVVPNSPPIVTLKIRTVDIPAGHHICNPSLMLKDWGLVQILPD